jgi:serine/threonine protein kinase
MVRMLKAGKIIEFDRKKQFKYIKPLGSGGTGDTHLFEDETTDMLFAFKKYAPKDLDYIDDHYKRFVDEIKILLKLSHPHVVRVYNYYLYPDLMLGYLQMEYITGGPIDKFVPDFWGKDWNSIFTDVVSAFEYLEMNKVLHRDVRPENILIDKEGNTKIIDFGFGKQLESASQNGKSIILNWPVTEFPEEVQFNREYNHKTEIYFVGKLFENILKDDIKNFKFKHIIVNMIKINPAERYNSFSEVSKAISAGILGEIYFSDRDKVIYRKFANELFNHINYYMDKYSPIDDLNVTLVALAELINDSILEEYLQDNPRLIECFIGNGFSYKPINDIPVACITDFYQFLTRLTSPKQKVVLDNIYTRLSKIKIEVDEEVPF